MNKKQIIPAQPISAYPNVNEGWAAVAADLEPIIDKWLHRINTHRPDRRF